jgi:hypothetical protein
MSDPQTDLRVALLQHIESQVVFGDTKASLIVAADALLIAGYIAGIKEFGLSGVLSRTTVMLLIASLVILVAGLILALIAVLPYRGHWRKSSSEHMDSVLLFSRIARYRSSTEYAEAFSQLDEASLNNQILFQVYGKSCWALYKYGVIFCSVWLTIISVSMATISILIDLVVRVGR